MWNLRVFAIISSGGQHRYQPTPDENVTSRERVITLMLRGSTFPLVIIKEDILGAACRKHIIVCRRNAAGIVWARQRQRIAAAQLAAVGCRQHRA
jgi:hypothetical protein